jgi:hypothetical protein
MRLFYTRDRDGCCRQGLEAARGRTSRLDRPLTVVNDAVQVAAGPEVNLSRAIPSRALTLELRWLSDTTSW